MTKPASTAGLIDELGKINKVLEPYEATFKRREAIKNQLKERVAGDTTVVGDHYAISITSSVSERLDVKRINAEMSADWLQKYTVPCVKRTLICYKIVRKAIAARKRA